MALAWCLAAPTAPIQKCLLAQALAADPARYASMLAKKAEIKPTSGNKAFTMWWQPAGSKPPVGVIVSLSGHDGWAHDVCRTQVLVPM